MKVNCVLTSGLMPTPPIPGCKLPVAVGWRSPILRVAFTLSTARSCGDCNTLVLASLNTSCRVAPGIVVEKSAVERRPRLDKGTKVPLVLLVVGGVVTGLPFASVVGVVGVVVGLVTTW